MKNKLIEFARLDDSLYVTAIEEFDKADLREAFLLLCMMSKLDSCLEIMGLKEGERKGFLKILCTVDTLVSSGLMSLDKNNSDINELVQVVKNEAKRLSERSVQ
jgi:hypothetical protein